MNLKSFTSMLLAVCLLLSLFSAGASRTTEAATGLPFSDISDKYWALETIQWGYSSGLVKGYQDGQFKPGKTVTEAEFLTMLIRSYEPEVTASTKGNWAAPYYNRAKALNYPVKSYTALASRNQVITRAKVAEMIAAADGVNFSGNNAIRYLLAFGLANGSDSNQVSVASFKGSQPLTRAEALQFIKNFTDYGAGALLDRPQEASDPTDIPPVADR
ncbi:S-layer homology domain-containing protein [Paenibacillus sp. Z6-24]